MTTFNSHIKTLRIVLTPSRPVYEQGVRLGDTQGKYAKFENGRFQTDDKEIIEKLEKLPNFGVDFWKASDEPAQPQEPEQTQQESDIESLTKTQLLEVAKKREIEVDEKLNRQEILDLLKEK